MKTRSSTTWNSGLKPAKMIVGAMILLAVIVPLVRGAAINFEFVTFQMSLGLIIISVDGFSTTVSSGKQKRMFGLTNVLAVTISLIFLLVNIPVDAHNAGYFLAKYVTLSIMLLCAIVVLSRAIFIDW
jgi:hypothetical protein